MHDLSHDSATDVLIAARSFIASGLWCQDRLEDDDGNVCAYGACNLAQNIAPSHPGLKAAHFRGDYYGTPIHTDAHKRLNDAAIRLCDTDIVTVNNKLGRHDVLACFDLAIGPERLHETDHHADRATRALALA